MVSVLVSVIHRPGERIVPGLVRWVLQQQGHALSSRASFRLGVDIQGGKPFDVMRNRQASRFLETDYECLMPVDCDIVPPDDAIVRLLAHDKAICGIASLSFQFGEPFAVVLEAMPEEPHGYKQAKGLQGLKKLKDGAIGLACCLIKREVFERMSRPWFEEILIDDGMGSRDTDFVFCERVRALGHDIWVDCDRLTDHMAVISLRRINDLLIQEQAKKGTRQLVKINAGPTETGPEE